MNHQDAYIYIGENEIYSWIGSNASDLEHSKVTVVGKMISEENKMHLTIVDNRKKNINDPLLKIFNMSQFKNTKYDEMEAIETFIKSIKIFIIETDDIEVQMREVENDMLTSEMLKSINCVLLDTGVDIYLWIGSVSENDQKSIAMLQAEDMLTESGRNLENLIVVKEGEESVIFREYVLGMTSHDEDGLMDSNIIHDEDFVGACEAIVKTRPIEAVLQFSSSETKTNNNAHFDVSQIVRMREKLSNVKGKFLFSTNGGI